MTYKDTRYGEASEERPYFGMRLDLDPALVASVMMEARAETRKGDAGIKAIGVNPVDADLLDAVVRLVRLADKPGEQRVLAPLIKREIVYRLLAGGEGAPRTPRGFIEGRHAPHLPCDRAAARALQRAAED